MNTWRQLALICITLSTRSRSLPLTTLALAPTRRLPSFIQQKTVSIIFKMTLSNMFFIVVVVVVCLYSCLHFIAICFCRRIILFWFACCFVVVLLLFF